MPNENEVKLIAALRSGDYEQTTGTLRDSDGFCCLGVACEVFRKETGIGHWVRINGRTWAFLVGDHEGSDKILPTSVRKWLGWRGKSGECGPFVAEERGTLMYLTALNDNEVPFTDIATHIEQDKVDKIGDGY